MRFRLIFTLTVLACVPAMAQSFQKKLSMALPPGSVPLQVAWADINNDSLLDIILSLRTQNQISLVAFRNPYKGPSAPVTLARTPFQSGTFTFCDLDRNNKTDIAFSGTDTLSSERTEIYINSGSFIFQKKNSTLLPIAASRLAFSDMNNDGQTDLVLIRKSGSLSVFRNNDQQFTLLFDSTSRVADDFVISDFDGNGFNDIAYSSTDPLLTPEIRIIEFRSGFDSARTIRLTPGVHGRLETGNLDHTGNFDLVVCGENQNGQWITQSLLNHDSVFVPGRLSPGLKDADLRIADFDSDGKADIARQGNTASHTPVNRIMLFSGDSLDLPTGNLLFQSFGDFDRDGDLDVAQLSDTLAITVLENTTLAHNARPSPPTEAIGVYLFNRLFLYWKKASDDHTPVSSLTYDVLLQSASREAVASQFDTATSHRLAVSHGNHGLNNFSLLRIPSASYTFRLQSVDNAFVGSRVGGAGSVTVCVDVEQKNILSCKEQPVKLKEKQPVLWFSFRDGYLGTSDSISVDNPSDTLFSFLPQSGPACNLVTLYALSTSPQDTLLLTLNHTGCEGATIVLSTDAQWKEVTWKDSGKTQRGTGNTLSYTVTGDETFSATGHNDYGCFLKQTDNVKLSKPLLSVPDDHFKVLKGESVTLHATGVTRYYWQPPQSLNNPAVADPVATPFETTTYTVTGFDSVNCTAEAHVIVEVEQTAFVPNLFTPNGDGKNDDLRIYGLSGAAAFYFGIYNREGSLVYESHDWSVIVSHGWDGTKNGVAQPPGLYYWKIEGKYDNGSSVYLNGKTKGSVLLVR